MSEVVASARRLSRMPAPSARDLKAALKGLLNRDEKLTGALRSFTHDCTNPECARCIKARAALEF